MSGSLVQPRRGRAAIAVGLLAAVVGCSDAGSAARPDLARPDAAAGTPSARASSTLDPNRFDDGSPLTTLKACGAPPRGVAQGVPGLELPAGAVLTAVKPGSPLTQASGYVPSTPILVKRFYTEDAGLTVYNSEDEVYESEVLVGDGSRRTYVKAQAVCQTGSSLIVFIGKEGSDGGVPTPQGGG